MCKMFLIIYFLSLSNLLIIKTQGITCTPSTIQLALKEEFDFDVLSFCVITIGIPSDYTFFIEAVPGARRGDTLKIKATNANVEITKNYTLNEIMTYKAPYTEMAMYDFKFKVSKGGTNVINTFIPIGFTNRKCYKSCRGTDCIEPGNSLSHKCTICKDQLFPLETITGNCYDESTKPENTYKDSVTKKYRYCYESCKKCSTGEKDGNHNCDVCVDNYYTLEKQPKNCVENCPVGSIEVSKVCKECYPKCSTCSNVGDDTLHKCDTCLEEYNKESNGNCILACDLTINYWYIDLLNVRQCTTSSTCPREFPVLESLRKQCVENCKPESSCSYCKQKHLYLYEKSCIEKCPTHTIPDYDNHLCKYDAQKELENEVNTLKSSIQRYLNNPYLSQKTKYSIQVYSTGNLEAGQRISIANDLAFLKLGEIESQLRTLNQLGNTNPIIIMVIDIYRTTPLPNQVEYMFFDYKGNQLLNIEGIDAQGLVIETNLPQIDLVDYETAKLFKEMHKIDLFDINEPFFNDRCLKYVNPNNNKDTTLRDRRAEYTFNSKLCEQNCVYNILNFDNDRISCNCTLKEITFSNVDYISGESAFLDIQETMLSLMSCPLDKTIIISNISLWVFSGVLFINIISMLSFSLCNIQQTNALMYKFIAKSNFKLSEIPPAPPTQHNNFQKAKIKTKTIKVSNPNSTKISKMNSLNTQKTKAATNTYLHVQARTFETYQNEDFESPTAINNVGNEKQSTMFDIYPKPLRPMLMQILLSDYQYSQKNDVRSLCQIYGEDIRERVSLVYVFAANKYQPFTLRLYFFLFIFGYCFLMSLAMTSIDDISLWYNSSDIFIMYTLITQLVDSVIAAVIAFFTGYVLSFLITPKKFFENIIRANTNCSIIITKVNTLFSWMTWSYTIFFLITLTLTGFLLAYGMMFNTMYQNFIYIYLIKSGFAFIFLNVISLIVSFITALMRYLALRNLSKCLFEVIEIFR